MKNSKGTVLIELIFWVAVVFVALFVVSIVCNESISDFGKALGIKTDVQADEEICDVKDNSCPGHIIGLEDGESYTIEIFIDKSGSMGGGDGDR